MNWLKKIIHKWLFTYTFDLQVIGGGKPPIRVYKNDAGYDLTVLSSINIPAGEMINVPTGVRCKSTGVPAWLLLTGRSSTLIRHGLIVDDGIIDDGYTGELFIKVYNVTKKDVRLHPDMRIGQMVPMIHINCNFRYREKFKVKRGERGDKGFGSSGL